MDSGVTDKAESGGGPKRKRGMEIVWQTPANPPEAKDYIFRNGRRYVRPYYFEFISHAKNRWAGKTIVDCFSEEFKGRPYEYFVSAVKSGRIQVDGQVVPVSYIIQPSQRISHFLHRHEPPVIAWDVSILHEEPDVVTVCKPASVPVHPCGQYRKNTVVGILQAEQGLTPLFRIRLNAGKADHFRQQIEAGLLRKQYIAKVIGAFPDEEKIVDANVNYNAREGRSSVEVPEQSNSKPLKGKPACTKFTRISTNGHHSLVLCEPITGRTHQIRVHLQYAGHPIANDMLYLSGKDITRSAQGMGADRAAISGGLPVEHESGCQGCGDMHYDEEFDIDPMCTNCPDLSPKGYDGIEEGLWLHCLQYSGPGWSYECPYPDWAVLD